MQEQEIKLDLIQWIAETNDIESIKKIQTIRNSSIHLTPEQESILDKRMEKYEQGLMKFSSWDEVKERIVKK
jgi:hypothetical protein